MNRRFWIWARRLFFFFGFWKSTALMNAYIPWLEHIDWGKYVTHLEVLSVSEDGRGGDLVPHFRPTDLWWKVPIWERVHRSDPRVHRWFCIKKWMVMGTLGPLDLPTRHVMGGIGSDRVGSVEARWVGFRFSTGLLKKRWVFCKRTPIFNNMCPPTFFK